MNNKKLSPSIIARETLINLASKKIPPTPDNYQKIYHQIAGLSDDHVTDVQVKMLLELARGIPRHSQNLLDVANGLEQAANEKKWAKYKTILIRFFANNTSHLDNSSTPLKPGSSSDYSRNVSMQEGSDNSAAKQNLHQDSNTSLINEDFEVDSYSMQFLKVVVQLLEHVSFNSIEKEAVAEDIKKLALKACKIKNKQELKQFINSLEQLSATLEPDGENGMLLQQGIRRILNLIMDSAGQLLSEDQWIKEQISSAKETISDSLSLEDINQVEQILKKIAQRKQAIKDRLVEAKTVMKQMVTSLISNLEELSTETGDYSAKLENFSERIGRSDDVADISLLIDDVIQETKQVQENLSTYSEVILTSRAEARGALLQINQLETKLQEMSEKASEDHLTGALNRRGFDNAYQREISIAARNEKQLCFALLDIDNFKQLNDTYGHDVGDKVLVYLVEAVKKVVRLEDIVSRYGGEEFAILLPNTMIESAVEILERVRRHIVKEFFLHENKRILVTFSAGVTQYQPGDSQQNLYQRADKALYQAKRNGKNQIVVDAEVTQLIHS
ncbi:MAG: diguanylate cyclase [Nitrosomonas sp.]|nr:diguanylate cyclase [Nitrosomonas sp.]